MWSGCYATDSKRRDVSMIKKIKTLSLPESVRVIVISDIHGELDLLKSLLKKVNFNREDYLIINGDICEKGSNSLDVVRFIKALSEEYPNNVHVIEGNCDTLVDELLEADPWILTYISKRKNTLINDCLSNLQLNLETISNIHVLREILLKNFGSEMNWLHTLPTAIETDHFIFVHAGLHADEDWKETSRESAITMPSYHHIIQLLI